MSLKNEQEAATRKATALAKIAEMYPDAKSEFGGRIVAPSLRLQDAGRIIMTEEHGWAAFFVDREVDGVRVNSPTVQASRVLEWLRVNQPEALEAAMRAAMKET